MSNDEPKVIDLGEDGEAWLITGTSSGVLAEIALTDHLREQGVLDDYDPTPDAAGNMRYRDDWYWHPVVEGDENGDAYLYSVREHGETSAETFSGWMVTL